MNVYIFTSKLAINESAHFSNDGMPKGREPRVENHIVKASDQVGGQTRAKLTRLKYIYIYIYIYVHICTYV